MSDRSDVSIDRCSSASAGAPAAVTLALPPDGVVEAAADAFSLLGDPNRLRLLACLLGRRDMCVSHLAAATGQSESAASHALRLLRAHGVVKVRRLGRRAYYRLADVHVETLLLMGLRHTDHSQRDAHREDTGT